MTAERTTVTAAGAGREAPADGTTQTGPDHNPAVVPARSPVDAPASAPGERVTPDPHDPGPVPDEPLHADLVADLGRNLAAVALAVGNLGVDLRAAGPHAGEYLFTLRQRRHELDQLIRAVEQAGPVGACSDLWQPSHEAGTRPDHCGTCSERSVPAQ